MHLFVTLVNLINLDYIYTRYVHIYAYVYEGLYVDLYNTQ